MRELERHASGDTPLPSLAIIGPGRVGSTLARLCSEAGYEVRLAGREDALEACGAAEVAILCVPDGEIEAACAVAAAAARPPRFVGHTSGATPLSALSAAGSRGAALFSIHPLQTIPDAGASLTGAPAAVAGDSSEALAVATALAQRVGMNPFSLAEADRAAYHAAACIASNFLVALEESAVALLARSGVDEPRQKLAPLVLRSASNWAERGPDALTGPIARGDAATLARHLEAIDEAHPELVDLYRVMAERTREIAAATTGASW